MASVTLLDSDHVWICAASGMGACHKPWSIAMCPWTLLSPSPLTLAVESLADDARFSGSVHAQAGTKSYLTAPLVASNGHRLGAICFTDTETRKYVPAAWVVPVWECLMLDTDANAATHTDAEIIWVCMVQGRRMAWVKDGGDVPHRLEVLCSA